MASEPDFSPDGGRGACAAETGGRYAIHVIDVETGGTTVWTTGTAQEGQPCWTRRHGDRLHHRDR